MTEFQELYSGRKNSELSSLAGNFENLKSSRRHRNFLGTGFNEIGK
jgi:hypothetical protein